MRGNERVDERDRAAGTTCRRARPCRGHGCAGSSPTDPSRCVSPSVNATSAADERERQRVAAISARGEGVEPPLHGRGATGTDVLGDVLPHELRDTLAVVGGMSVRRSRGRCRASPRTTRSPGRGAALPPTAHAGVAPRARGRGTAGGSGTRPGSRPLPARTGWSARTASSRMAESERPSTSSQAVGGICSKIADRVRKVASSGVAARNTSSSRYSSIALEPAEPCDTSAPSRVASEPRYNPAGHPSVPRHDRVDVAGAELHPGRLQERRRLAVRHRQVLEARRRAPHDRPGVGRSGGRVPRGRRAPGSSPRRGARAARAGRDAAPSARSTCTSSSIHSVGGESATSAPKRGSTTVARSAPESAIVSKCFASTHPAGSSANRAWPRSAGGSLSDSRRDNPARRPVVERRPLCHQGRLAVAGRREHERHTRAARPQPIPQLGTLDHLRTEAGRVEWRVDARQHTRARSRAPSTNPRAVGTACASRRPATPTTRGDARCLARSGTWAEVPMIRPPTALRCAQDHAIGPWPQSFANQAMTLASCVDEGLAAHVDDHLVDRAAGEAERRGVVGCDR